MALLDQGGNVVAKNTANIAGIIRVNQFREQNSNFGTILCVEGYNSTQRIWKEVRAANREELAKAEKVQVTYTANGTSYVYQHRFK